MKKYIFFSPIAFSQSEKAMGGIMASSSTYLENMPEHLSEKYKLITLKNSNCLFESKKLIFKKNSFDCDVYSSKYHLLPFSLFFLIKDLLNNRDKVLHANGSFFYLFISFFFKKSLLQIHGIYRNETKVFKDLRIDLKTLISWFVEKIYFKFGKNFLSLSDETTALIARENSSAKTYRINNCVDNSFYNLRRQPQKNSVLFVAALVERKGLLDLLKAIKLIKTENLTLNIVGPTNWDQDYFGKCKKFVDENNLKNINFKGLLSKSELLEEYQNNQILCLPSYSETAPMVISQALASKMTVLSTSVGEIPKMLGENEAFLFEPGNVRILSEKLPFALNESHKFKFGTLPMCYHETKVFKSYSDALHEIHIS